MGCPQCQHENRRGAGFCDECGFVLDPTERRPRARRAELAVAFAIVAGGVALIAGIVLTSPGWQKLFAAWRDRSPGLESPDKLRPAPPQTTPAPAVLTTAPSPPVTSARAADSPRPVERARPAAPHDMAQVMATLLISQLGQDPAWRTALANAEAHAPDSPEHAYWGRVAAAVREGGIRLR